MFECTSHSLRRGRAGRKGGDEIDHRLFALAQRQQSIAGQSAKEYSGNGGDVLATGKDEGIRKPLADLVDQFTRERPFQREHHRDADNLGFRIDAANDLFVAKSVTYPCRKAGDGCVAIECFAEAVDYRDDVPAFTKAGGDVGDSNRGAASSPTASVVVTVAGRISTTFRPCDMASDGCPLACVAVEITVSLMREAAVSSNPAEL